MHCFSLINKKLRINIIELLCVSEREIEKENKKLKMLSLNLYHWSFSDFSHKTYMVQKLVVCRLKCVTLKIIIHNLVIQNRVQIRQIPIRVALQSAAHSHCCNLECNSHWNLLEIR